jgi:hypothetical protein
VSVFENVELPKRWIKPIFLESSGKAPKYPFSLREKDRMRGNRVQC